jgi:hypothetical protein
VTDTDARVAEIEARLAKVQALEQRARQAGWEGDLSSGTFAEEETVQLVYKFTLEDVPWLLARLREAERESLHQMQEKLDAQVCCQCIVAALDMTMGDLADGWRASTPLVLTRLDVILEEYERAIKERDESRARLREAEQALAKAQVIVDKWDRQMER